MTGYLEIPNLPQNKVSKVIADYRLGSVSVKELTNMGIEICFSTNINCLYDAVCGHPDMQIHHLGNSRFVCAREAYQHYLNMLDGAEFIIGEKPLKEKYPDDIYYNAAALGRHIICRMPSTDKSILERYDEDHIMNTNQGYAKCNIAVIHENALITSDKGIYKKALDKKIDALLIQNGFIELKGLPYGFIGGASGKLSYDVLAVNGNIDTHPDAQNIKAFCGNYGVYIISLNNGILSDTGSIIPIMQEI